MFIPPVVCDNVNLTRTDLLLIGLIVSFTKNKEYCFASNKYFADKIKVSSRTISKSLSNLRKMNYIAIEYENYKRKIYNKVWNDNSRGIDKDFYAPLEESYSYNNKYNNIKKNINNKAPDWFENYNNLKTEPITKKEDKEFIDKLEKEFN